MVPQNPSAIIQQAESGGGTKRARTDLQPLQILCSYMLGQLLKAPKQVVRGFFTPSLRAALHDPATDLHEVLTAFPVSFNGF